MVVERGMRGDVDNIYVHMNNKEMDFGRIIKDRTMEN